jgi:hypothetical protein
MRRLTSICAAVIAALAAFAACQPEAYTGPLDYPEGNWDGIRSEYFFNGEKVADVDSCETLGVSFYKQGLCCFEGVKGAFPFKYDDQTRYLQIDSTLWEVSVLTGAELVMTYLYTLYPSEPETPEVASEEGEEPVEPSEPVYPSEPTDPENPEEPVEPEVPEVPEVKPDKNGVILPAEYNGCEINADKNGYFYINETAEKVYCKFKGWTDQDKTLIIDFWYDRHTDYFIPLVVETKKK